jgi:hypothetical protein
MGRGSVTPEARPSIKADAALIEDLSRVAESQAATRSRWSSRSTSATSWRSRSPWPVLDDLDGAAAGLHNWF